MIIILIQSVSSNSLFHDVLFFQLLNSADLDLKKYELDERYADVVNFYFDEVSLMSLNAACRWDREISVEHGGKKVNHIYNSNTVTFTGTQFEGMKAKWF